MIINDLDDYYIVFDTKNRNIELDTLVNIIGNIIQQTLSKGDKIQVKEYRRENKYN